MAINRWWFGIKYFHHNWHGVDDQYTDFDKRGNPVVVDEYELATNIIAFGVGYQLF